MESPCQPGEAGAGGTSRTGERDENCLPGHSESQRILPRRGFVEVKGCTLEENGLALFPDAPTVITGDMNAEPDSPEMSALRTAPYQNVTAGTGVTYHGYGRGDPPCAIDYILTRGFTCESVEKWTDCRDGVYLSDHYPVCAHIRPAKP